MTIITAFTVAESHAEAKKHGIKKYKGDPCERDGNTTRYTSTKRCIKCQGVDNVKAGKAPKIPNKFYCRQHQEYFDMSFLGERTRYYSLCKTCKESRDNQDAAIRAGRQKP
jgi:hypothetical protein